MPTPHSFRPAAGGGELQVYLRELVQPQLHLGRAIQPRQDGVQPPLRRARGAVQVGIDCLAVSPLKGDPRTVPN